MNGNRNYYAKLGIFLMLLLWLGVFMAEKIDLATADLGRHLQNGRWVVENNFNIFEKKSPLHENFYSYTHSDFEVVNHHWGSGAFFFLVWKYIGFGGLSFLYIFLSLAAFSIFFWIAWRESDFTLAALLSFFLAPLMAERVEIRPEVWSVFFAAIFFFVLWRHARKNTNWKWLLLLVPLQIVWANFHVYFFLGIFLAGTFWLAVIFETIFRKMTDDEFAENIRKTKVLTVVLIFLCLASFVNPFGLEGFLQPLKIFKNYGYTIVENKSVGFVESYGVANPNFALVKAVLIMTILSYFLLAVANRKKISAPYFLFSVFFGLAGWMAIRNFTLLGFFALPVLASNFQGVFGQEEKGKVSIAKENGVALLYIALISIGIWCNFQYVGAHREKAGIGLAPGVWRAAEFLERENVPGPIFNNYDIGGYLIFSLPAGEKVFVDNRPEAYPDAFFSEVYKPMQEDPAVFEKIDKEYNFNAIVFSRNDITPWGINFLKMIGENQDWAKVFEDDYAVIYVKTGNRVNSED